MTRATIILLSTHDLINIDEGRCFGVDLYFFWEMTWDSIIRVEKENKIKLSFYENTKTGW